MFCTKCGQQLADGSKFCTACGSPVSGGSAAPASQPVWKTLTMAAEGVTLVQYKFNVRDEAGNIRYKAATVSESMTMYNAHLMYPNDQLIMRISQTNAEPTMDFNLLTADRRVITPILQQITAQGLSYVVPAFNLTMQSFPNTIDYHVFRNGQEIARITETGTARQDVFTITYCDHNLEQVFLGIAMAFEMTWIATKRSARR